MAVLVEGISVVVRRKAIDSKLAGGWTQFLTLVPNATLCTDDDLARVGFMSPADTQQFIARLEQSGLVYLCDGRCHDIAVVDQIRGPTDAVDWLECAKVTIGQIGGKVGACWLFEGSRIAAGIHLSGEDFNLATPAGWSYENSLSAKFTFVPLDQAQARLRFLRNEGGISVLLDTNTGKQVYGSDKTQATYERAATIPVRHGFKNYLCSIGYSESEDLYHLFAVTGKKSGKPTTNMKGYEIYRRIFNEPILHLRLVKELFPEKTDLINSLTEKALEQRCSDVGTWLVITTIFMIWVVLGTIYRYLSRFLGNELAGLIIAVPFWFAFMAGNYLKYKDWMLRRYCIKNGHRLKTFTFKDRQDRDMVLCERCGSVLVGSVTSS